MNKYICIHGHFYQPPRENPWLNEVELQDSAYPYHDWNDRITAECYARNSASRILDNQGYIIDIVNNYSRISFNFGPTLLEWMEKKKPQVYQAILEADKESKKRYNGHGSAIAQVYNHMIMPLANERDKHTQVIWGIRDFERRFKRMPKGMWCGETAVDTPTLEVLAEYGIEFTILSPYQARRVRLIGDKNWTDATNAKVDTRNAYVCNLPSGKKINIFYYNGPISQGIAFEGLLNNGEAFANRLISQLNHHEQPQLVNIATDGESYGHHHRFGEMGLSYCLHHIETYQLAKLTVYSEFLEKHPPIYETEIVENSSWSCAHGVERWRSNCGCHTGGRPDWHQQWREPLREAFDWLRDKLIPVFEQEMMRYVRSPWEIRNQFINILTDRSPENVDYFISQHCQRDLSYNEKARILKLLEMQYHTMLMYTSCGWFFDEVTGIETMQDILYAGRAIQLAREITEENLEPKFLKLLERVPSNNLEFLHAANAYKKLVRPAMLNLLRVGAHFAVSSIFADYPEEITLYSYTATAEHYEQFKAGKQTLAIGKIILTSDITWEKNEVSFAVLHLGDHNLYGGVREFLDNDSFEIMRKDVSSAFKKGNLLGILSLMDNHFGTHNYSFWHLFKDDQKKILEQVLEYNNVGVEGLFRQIFENNYPLVQAIKELNMALPKPLKIPVDFFLNNKIQKIIQEDPINSKELVRTIDEIIRMSVDLDQLTLEFITAERLNNIIEQFYEDYENISLIETSIMLLEEIKRLPINLDPWRAQNITFILGRKHYQSFLIKSKRGDELAQKWCTLYNTLCEELNLKFIQKLEAITLEIPFTN
ncbi:DUF3536 domain-containing protein [soil metagenome]